MNLRHTAYVVFDCITLYTYSRLFVMSKYRQHATSLMRAEKKLAEFLGSSIASVDR